MKFTSVLQRAHRWGGHVVRLPTANPRAIWLNARGHQCRQCRHEQLQLSWRKRLITSGSSAPM
eukprot:5119682-Amphidinium_carterae.1